MKEDHSKICLYLEGRKLNEEINIKALTKQIEGAKEDIKDCGESIVESKEIIKAVDRAIKALKND